MKPTAGVSTRAAASTYSSSVRFSGSTLNPPPPIAMSCREVSGIRGSYRTRRFHRAILLAMRKIVLQAGCALLVAMAAAAEPPTPAAEAFAKGQEHLGHRTANDLRAAVQDFERATA